MTWSGQTPQDEWYWCLEHKAVEGADGCRAEVRMGPYRTRAEAEHWKDKVEARNEAWEAEDRRWNGED
jgi:hypothetical protein